MDTAKIVKKMALLLGMLGLATGPALAQTPATPTGEAKGLVLYESFTGDSTSDGQVMALTSSATYTFASHFNVGMGIPIYLSHISSSTTSGSTSSNGIGDVFATVKGGWKGSLVNYGMQVTGTGPTGSSDKGLSTGHVTWDWNNRVDHEILWLTPFLEGGVGDSITNTQALLKLRPYTSFGNLAHFQGGTDVDLTHKMSATLSAYDIAPWGTQTLISRVVANGATGKAGPVQHGRAFENAHKTIGTASLTRDNGFGGEFQYSPKPFLDLSVGYSHSVHYALNTISFGAGVNVSRLLSKNRS
jgi:hypothetical protein